MKVTKAIIAAVAAKFNMTSEQASACLNGEGIYRGAHNLDLQDFSSAKVQSVTGLDDDKLTFETFSDRGSLKKGTPACLLIAPSDIGYSPIPGEHLLVWMPDDDKENGGEYVPAVMKEFSGRTKVVAISHLEEEPVEDTVALSYVLLPVQFMTAAGPVSQSMYQLAFSSGYDQEALDAMATTLVDAELTINDLYEYLVTPMEELEGTKFHKRLARKMKLAGHDILKYLATGDLIAVKAGKEAEVPKAKTTPKTTGTKPAAKAPAKAAPKPTEAEPETTAKERFDSYVDAVKGTELKNLYAGVCKIGKVKEDDMETSSKLIKAHIKDLVKSDARINALIKADMYEDTADA